MSQPSSRNNRGSPLFLLEGLRMSDRACVTLKERGHLSVLQNDKDKSGQGFILETSGSARIFGHSQVIEDQTDIE